MSRNNGQIVINRRAPDIEQAIEESRITFAGVDASQLREYQSLEPDWLVEGIFSADQPTVFGAASKATKTTQLIDLAVALSTESKWMNHFIIPKRRKTLLITGESNYRACSKRIARALSSRRLDWSDVKDHLRIEAIEFPSLSSVLHQDQITKDVAEHGFEVVMVDPLYRGLTGIDTHRMSEVGPAIVAFTKAVQPASSIFSHHVTKTSARDLSGPPSLEDLSGAGLAESCGNWWLLGRNEPYNFDRIHDLIVQYGGRDEQSGILRIVFNEADWSFKVTSGADLKDQKQRERDERKQVDRENKRREAVAGVRYCLANETEPRSKDWIEKRSGVSQDRTRAAIAEMLNEGGLIEEEYRDSRNVIQKGLILCQSR